MDRNQEREAQVIVNKEKSEIRATRAHMTARAHILLNENSALVSARVHARDKGKFRLAALWRLTRPIATWAPKKGGLTHA